MEPLYGWAQIEGDRAAELQLLLQRHSNKRDLAHLFFQTCTPRVYRSSEELEWWRDRFEKNVSLIEELAFSPEEGLYALRFLDTSALCYQQKNDRDVLSRLYTAIVAKMHRRFMPQHSEPLPRQRRHARLRVGYISENLNASNGAIWALGWMKNHGPEIETYAFSLSTRTDLTEALYRGAVDHYFSLGRSYLADADVVKNQKLDVLIYTDVGTGATTAYFAGLRLAPVQCAAWGHPSTSGFPTIDYYLSGELMEPANGDQHYSEDLVRLPGIGVKFEYGDEEPAELTKNDLGLDEGPLLLSAQSPMKYLPAHDEVLRQINEATGRPIVFAGGFNEVLEPALRARMEVAGVRGIWLPAMGKAQFLALQKMAAVSIDTIGWSGGITTSDFLRLGVPVVTLSGEFMRGRMSAGFLRMCGGDGLIATNVADFVALTSDPKAREKAMQGYDGTRLFNDAAPVRFLDDWMLSLF
jgi:predicted O-linked N-acetylglucosamine transferase (SPINDLY family)